MTNQVEKLQQVEDELRASGVEDVKFFFGLDVGSYPLSKVKDSVANVLKAYCDGLLETHPGIDDTELMQVQAA